MGKPLDWNKLSHEIKREIALGLLNSLRGQFIISQALARAIEVMKKDKPYPEKSNIEDMEILHEELFPIYQPEVMKMGKELAKKKLKKVVE